MRPRMDDLLMKDKKMILNNIRKTENKVFTNFWGVGSKRPYNSVTFFYAKIGGCTIVIFFFFFFLTGQHSDVALCMDPAYTRVYSNFSIMNFTLKFCTK